MLQLKFFYFQILCFDKKIKIVKVKKINAKRRKNMVGVLSKEEYRCDMGSRRRTGTQRRTPPHLATTTFSQRCKAWPRPSMPTSTSATWWVATTVSLTGGCISMCPLCPHPINARQVQTIFLGEEDYWREERVVSSRIWSRKLWGRREDQG